MTERDTALQIDSRGSGAALLDELERLAELKRNGGLDESEFARMKTAAIVSAQAEARSALVSRDQRKKAAATRKAVAGILLLGLPLAVYGGYLMAVNQPIDEQAAVREADDARARELSGKRDIFGNPMNSSLFGAADRRMSATSKQFEVQSQNKTREERRARALLFLVPGALLTLLGAVCLVDRVS